MFTLYFFKIPDGCRFVKKPQSFNYGLHKQYLFMAFTLFEGKTLSYVEPVWALVPVWVLCLAPVLAKA